MTETQYNAAHTQIELYMEVLDEKINENLIDNIPEITVSDVEKLIEERPGRFADGYEPCPARTDSFRA